MDHLLQAFVNAQRAADILRAAPADPAALQSADAAVDAAWIAFSTF